MLGHSDRNGPLTFATVRSWNTAHPSRRLLAGWACAPPAATGCCIALR